MKKSSVLMLLSGIILTVGIVLIIAGGLSGAFSFSSKGIWLPDNRLEDFFDELSDLHISFGTSDQKMQQSETYENTFSDIAIDVISADVLLVPSDDNSYHVETVYRENEPITVSQEGDSLRIKQGQQGGFFFFHWLFGFDTQVKLYVPKKALCSKLTVATISGNITWKLEGKTANALSLSTVSGDIRGGKILAQSISLSSTSGEISGAVNAETLKLSNTSGDIDLSMQQVRDLHAGTVSGDIRLSGAIQTSAELNTVSGDVTLSLPDRPSHYTLHFSSVSGDCTVTGANMADMENGAVSLRVGTTSGDLHLQF